MKKKKQSIYELVPPQAITPQLIDAYNKEQSEKAKLEKQFKHNWKLAIFNTCAGGIAGLITSLIFWLITKQ